MFEGNVIVFMHFKTSSYECFQNGGNRCLSLCEGSSTQSDYFVANQMAATYLLCWKWSTPPTFPMNFEATIYIHVTPNPQICLFREIAFRILPISWNRQLTSNAIGSENDPLFGIKVALKWATVTLGPTFNHFLLKHISAFLPFCKNFHKNPLVGFDLLFALKDRSFSFSFGPLTINLWPWNVNQMQVLVIVLPFTLWPSNVTYFVKLWT